MARSLTLLAVLAACQPAFEAPAPPDRGLTVTLEPEAPLDRAPPVLRLRIIGAAGREAPEHLMLFEGTLSTYHLGRIRRDDLPKTLVERQVPVMAWEEGRDLVVAPTRRLEPEVTYALASPALGGVVDVRVGLNAPVRERFWPPPGAAGTLSEVAYCSEGPDTDVLSPLRFDPEGPTVNARRGLGAHGIAADRCRELVGGFSAAKFPLVPAPWWDGQLVEPEPLLPGPALDAPPLACEPAEVAIGPACARVEDDRLLLRSGDEPLGIALRTPTSEVVTRVGARGFVSIAGLIPATVNHVWGSVFGLQPRHDIALSIMALPPIDRIVLNEVMANPLGPEPAQEWVELINAGGVTVQLAGWKLSDGSAETTLPESLLAPGAFALIVSDAFDATSTADVAVAPKTVLLRVPSLGKAGLSNAGEALTLSAPDGQVASRFPALPKPSKGGRSVARTSPDAVDADPSAFAPHAAPGASPGAPNAVE